MIRFSLLTVLLFLVSCQKYDDIFLPPLIDPVVRLHTPLPDFGAIPDVALKKQTFFEFMAPIVEQENLHILKLRTALLQLQKKMMQPNSRLSRYQQLWLNNIARKYESKFCQVLDPACLDDLLLRVDKIPASLVLAQAANESAWGTSRFARRGNNFFGQWCFVRGCGMVPSQRDEGFVHEVKVFKSVDYSVRAYLLNLNTNPAYKKLRKIRRQLRENSNIPDGTSLAVGLSNYSQRGQAYVQEIIHMIEYNNLKDYEIAI
ncbi:glucosaminidase domain-containing protein [Gynuella sunshinyii]|uniref:Putative FlgJ-related protein n=1 Tax=Gynuella sunshinyii YC6258 TaxID=1445510 RepID=A0A0C5VHD4_9GAMM|nr:glucosaminidase domain-containing protein [Gynuella sunshinyii]AJQ93661.1 putative FlgJ-related protein [Gynuella sunshinyii YC6258]